METIARQIGAGMSTVRTAIARLEAEGWLTRKARRQGTGAGCIARADFEARQRAARTDETTYVVQGWRQGNGTLWQPNQRVIVFDPVCGFDNTELLVSEVTFTQDQNGTLTEIRVGPPDAYLPEPEAPGARKKKKARVQEDPF
ncbi:phage baseplate assembly protein [Escherichia coli]|uniref:phage baseplate assembly protein n=1 Tax=Escherichia coli TaxID=562 RepID=UPI003B592B6D